MRRRQHVNALRRVRALGFVALVCLLAGCGSLDREVSIGDATQVQRLVLSKSPGGGPVHALSLSGSGRIEGEATISLILNGRPYKTERLSGRVSFEWKSDWYADTAEVRYEPRTVESGKLVLRYRFHSV